MRVAHCIPRRHLRWYLPVRERVRASAFISRHRRPVATCKSVRPVYILYGADGLASVNISQTMTPSVCERNLVRFPPLSVIRCKETANQWHRCSLDRETADRYDGSASIVRAPVRPKHCKSTDVRREIHKTVGCPLVVR